MLSARRDSLSTSASSTILSSLNFSTPITSITTVAITPTRKKTRSALFLLSVPLIPNPSNLYLLLSKSIQEIWGNKQYSRTKISLTNRDESKKYFLLIYILVGILILTMFIPMFPILKTRLLSLSNILLFPLLICLNLLLLKETVKVILVIPRTVTLVSFLMASMVLLVMVLIHIFFWEFKNYRDKVVRSIYRQEIWAHVLKTWTRPSTTFIPEVSANSITFVPPPSFINHTPLASSSSAIKHGLYRGSHTNRPAWHWNNKRHRFPLFLFLILTSLQLTKK